MEAETFYEYITNVFYTWLVKENIEFSVILYLDDHSSHVNIPLVTFCREKQIELLALHPNSTHIMQPLDISFCHPFKETLKKTFPKRKNMTGVERLKKEKFRKVLKMALDNMKKFKATGLMPFDSNAVDYDVLQKKMKIQN